MNKRKGNWGVFVFLILHKDWSVFYPSDLRGSSPEKVVAALSFRTHTFGSGSQGEKGWS